MLVENNSERNYELLPPAFTSWLGYWEHHQNGGKELLYVHCAACNGYVARTNVVGSVVRECEPCSGRSFVVPMCQSCYEKNQRFAVDNYLLVER